MPGKIYKVIVTLPELVAAHAEQQARVEAGNWWLAVKLACDEISKRPHVRGKHIKSAKIQFNVVENEDRPAQSAADSKSATWSEEFLFEL